jgi:hypothetical protein
MRQMISILATALLATSLLTVQAEARGGGGGGGGGHAGGMGGGFGGHAGGMGSGFGGGAHIGGLGGGAHIGAIGGLGAHIGGDVGHIGALGGTHIGGIGTGGHIGAGFHGGVVGNADHFDGARGIDRGHARFAMHRRDRIYPYYYDNGCYDWYLLHPDTTVPPYCS